MVRSTIAAATAVATGLLPPSSAPSATDTLLTIPQHDRLRSRLSAPSASISADGRWIAFASYGRLTPDDQDDSADIYLLDRSGGSVALMSAPSEELALRADCSNPHLSGDGRAVVFETSAAAGGLSEIVRRDVPSGAIRIVSRGASRGPANGPSRNPGINDDGQVIVFESSATNLVEGSDGNAALPDIYVWEGGTDRIRRLTADTRGVHSASTGSIAPTISGDGRYVAFASMIARSTTSRQQQAHDQFGEIFLHDLQRDAATPIRGPGSAPNNWSAAAVISRDGRSVAFVSAATNLVSGDRNGVSDVFVFDVTSGSIALVSRAASGGTANGPSASPSISADGRYVAFQSDASNLVCNQRCADGREDINLLPDVFLSDRTSGRVSWMSSADDRGWMEESVAPAINGTGAVVAFTSRHPIDGGDMGHDFDLFVRILER